jgi:DnaK suppressor protein
MDTAYFHKRLEEERGTLEDALNKLGVRNSSADPNNWDVKRPDIDIMEADLNEAADLTEEIGIDSIVLDELETRHRNVSAALERMANNTYGACVVCGADIEHERLDANPAARTCKAHIDTEDTLA